MPLTESVHQAATTSLDTTKVPSSETSAAATTIQRPADSAQQLCWIEEKSSPLQADHHVELLHLQAEADALLVKLQAVEAQKV